MTLTRWPGTVPAAVPLADFDFDLPRELIAQEPLAQRDASRLLHVSRETGQWAHRHFADLASLLLEGDLLVFNDSKVIPARLLGKKAGSGGRVELLLVRPETSETNALALQGPAGALLWRCLGQASKPIRAGAKLEFDAALTAEVDASYGNGEYRVRFTSPLASLHDAIARAGRLPLPPYIERAPRGEDDARYNTVFANAPGSVAAPTAGLHFTPALLDRLRARGVSTAFVTLEVGPGTFMPIRGDDVDAHVMHTERYELPHATVEAIAKAKRVIAVGTTVTRTLEAAGSRRTLRPGHSETNIFIRPGARFQVIDALITNFHLPKSTLLMLVSAFLGTERTRAAYAEAIRERYRFFSYGDAMFIDGAR